MLFRFYLGRGMPLSPFVWIAPDAAARIVAQTFQGFTMFEATGYWEGKPEPALVFEILAREDEWGKVQNLAVLLRDSFKQSSVLMVTIPEATEIFV